MARINRVLFVVENDHFPQDVRVYNECKAVSRLAECLVLAPRARRQAFREDIAGIKCYRYPATEAASLWGIPLEYLIAFLSIAIFVPAIVLIKRVRVVHVANPPDFIIPSVVWLRLFRVRLVFDAHDLSTETLKGKLGEKNTVARRLLPVLELLEMLSVRFANLVVATNESISARVRRMTPDRSAVVVRNSNPVKYRKLTDVPKPARSNTINVGFFGLLANDKAAGLGNIVDLARALCVRGASCRFSIVGTGPGLAPLRQLAADAGLADRFDFVGFVPISEAYSLISSFDFGLVSWGDMPKNNIHTAMKVMDYMCCGVPVCSLPLTEQLRSTGGIGVHAASFDAIAEKMISVFRDLPRYEKLRERTLQHFNETLCWELQEETLLRVYRLLLDGQ